MAQKFARAHSVEACPLGPSCSRSQRGRSDNKFTTATCTFSVRITAHEPSDLTYLSSPPSPTVWAYQGPAFPRSHDTLVHHASPPERSITTTRYVHIDCVRALVTILDAFKIDIGQTLATSPISLEVGVSRFLVATAIDQAFEPGGVVCGSADIPTLS